MLSGPFFGSPHDSREIAGKVQVGLPVAVPEQVLPAPIRAGWHGTKEVVAAEGIEIDYPKLVPLADYRELPPFMIDVFPFRLDELIFSRASCDSRTDQVGHHAGGTVRPQE